MAKLLGCPKWGQVVFDFCLLFVLCMFSLCFLAGVTLLFIGLCSSLSALAKTLCAGGNIILE